LRAALAAALLALAPLATWAQATAAAPGVTAPK
jgi:hypothetical protein